MPCSPTGENRASSSKCLGFSTQNSPHAWGPELCTEQNLAAATPLLCQQAFSWSRRPCSAQVLVGPNKVPLILLPSSPPPTSIYAQMSTSRRYVEDFPSGPVVQNLPCNAGDAVSIPGWGNKIPCTKEQLSPRAATTEAHKLRRPCAITTESSSWNERSCMLQLRPDASELIKKKKRMHVDQATPFQGSLGPAITY